MAGHGPQLPRKCIPDTLDLAFKGGCNSVSGGCSVTRGLSPGAQFRCAPCWQHVSAVKMFKIQLDTIPGLQLTRL